MTNNLVERIRNRIHDAPLETEYLLDECANVIEALSTTPGREEIAEVVEKAIRQSTPWPDERDWHNEAWLEGSAEEDPPLITLEQFVSRKYLGADEAQMWKGVSEAVADAILSLLRKEGV